MTATTQAKARTSKVSTPADGRKDRRESRMAGYTGFVEMSELRKLPIRITKYVEEAKDAVDMRVLARSTDESRFASHVREALQSPFFLDLFDDPVPVNKTLIAICGDFTSAALLTHLTQRLWGTLATLMVNGEPVYLPNAVDDRGRKWCITSLAELGEITCLTPAELKKARRNLVQLSLIMEGGVKRCPHALAFALNEQAIDRATTTAAVNKYLSMLPIQDDDTGSSAASETTAQNRFKPIVPEAPRNVLAPLDEFEAATTIKPRAK